VKPAEDHWKEIRIGRSEVPHRQTVQPLQHSRIDPAPASAAEPLRRLAGLSQAREKIFFGQNVIADDKGKSMSGMTVELIA